MNLYSLVSAFLVKTSSVFPKQWRLPVRYFALWLSGMAEPELMHLNVLCKNFGSAIDIGANQGFYSYKMAQHFDYVFAFEANTQQAFDIRFYNNNSIHLFPFGLSDTTKKAKLFIPIQNGISLNGWASVLKRDLSFAQSYSEVPIQLQKLDDQDFVHTHQIDLIKIDVEGHELEVLKGGYQTIKTHKPVLIVENNIVQEQEILTFMQALGYRQTTLAILSKSKVSSPNVLYVPD